MKEDFKDLETSLEAGLWKFLAETAPLGHKMAVYAPDTVLKEFEVDSLTLLEAFFWVEENYGITLPPDTFSPQEIDFENLTFSQLTALIREDALTYVH
jgi:acyl carrier protein